MKRWVIYYLHMSKRLIAFLSILSLSLALPLIPASAVAKAKAGAKVAAVIRYNGTGGPNTMLTVLTVKP